MDAESLRELRLKIHKVFLPGTPINKYDLFSGRQKQMTEVISAVMQPGRHIILYGERGVGKTSLAKVLVDIQRHDNYRTLETSTINADESDDFSSFWRKVFRVMPYAEVDGRTIYLDELLPEGDVYPDDIRYCLSRFKEPSLVVLDEVDQLHDPAAKNLLAATIKNLSDHSVNTTLMLVGVADTVDELIAEHQSIERSLAQVRMPRMSRNEIEQIIDTGMKVLEMTIEDSAKNTIIGLSKGLPFYTHSLGLYSGLKAIDGGRTQITAGDVGLATFDVILNAQNVESAYHKATMSAQKNSRYDTALLACALIEGDELGFFSASDIRELITLLMGKEAEGYDVPNYKHYLTEFCEPKRGPVLQKVGEARRTRYRFKNALMRPFVVIHAFGTGRLSVESLVNIMEAKTKDETVH